MAERTGSSTLNYMLGDHLGSQAAQSACRIESMQVTRWPITTNTSGARTGEIRYYPWGTERYTWGTTPTTYHYTGQRLESSLGLYFYGARWYDPAAGRFLSADTIIPGGVQGLDRYAYAGNNPLRYIDPTGHDYCDSPYADPQECKDIDKNGNGKTDVPEPSLTTEHSNYPETSPYSGSEFLQLYELMLNDKDAWWNSNGEFNFTIFCGLLLMHEGAGREPYMGYDAIAANQQLYAGSWNAAYSPNGYSMIGACNYWAAFSQSAHGMVDKYVRGTSNIGEYTGYDNRGPKNAAEIIKTANELGNIMLFSKTDPRRNDALSDYGNDEDWVDRLLQTDIKPDTYYRGGNQGIYYYTDDGHGVWYSVNGYNLWN